MKIRNEINNWRTRQTNWEIKHTFTATAAHTGVQLSSLQWSATDGSTGNLFAANTFSAVSLLSGDTLTITWTKTVS